MKDYYSFWNIKRPVFSCLEIESDFFIAESQLGFAKRLMFFCQHGSPLIIVSAPDGNGKSTFARWLYDQLPTDTHEVLIVNLVGSPTNQGWLMERVVQFFGSTDGDLSNRALAAIDELIEEGKKLLLIIDNAQYLDTQKAFDEIAALMQLQSMTSNHMTFLLLSNTPVQPRMGNHSIASQINFSGEIKPLSLEECRDFIKFQLKNQGLREDLITDDSIFIIFEASKGIFRQIATIAENCLMEAFIGDERSIQPSTVIKAASYVVGIDEKILRDRFIPDRPERSSSQPEQILNHSPTKSTPAAKDELTNLHSTVKLRDLLYDDDAS
jgi:type II secretory pathway predicted ATPase ExeA